MSEALQSLSEALAAAVKTGGANVARIEARRRLSASGIVWSADGLVVTSHHVVERDENINVGLPDGQTVPAVLVGRDPSTDLALLRTQATGLAVPQWARSDGLQVGNLVLALGRPQESVLATMGIISALSDDVWRAPTGGRIDRYLQTDAVMYPGFSGGPLFDANGHVIGLNTSALLQGISLAIPAVTIQRVVDMLLTHGRVRQGYLGVGSQPVRLPAAAAQQLDQETGLLLVSVEADSPAEKGGLMLGDILIALDNVALRHVDNLLAGLGSDRVGQSVKFTVIRGGQIQEHNVVIGERSK